MVLKVALIGLLFLSLPLRQSASETGTGTVCVASRAATPFRGQVIPPTGEVSSGGLQVKIDKRPAMAWPQRESLKIAELSLTERHLLAVLDSKGKAVESFWFKFSDYKSVNLCIAYDGYQGIGLQESKGSPWCKCK